MEGGYDLPALKARHSGVSALSTFAFAPGLNLRAVLVDGDPWFVAKDVCDALGYTADVSATLTKHVDDDDRQPFNLNSLSNRVSIRGNPRVSVINESGLYALVLGSKKPEAKQFRKWVTSVVLPAIRKDGAYVLGEEKVATGDMEEDVLIDYPPD